VAAGVRVEALACTIDRSARSVTEYERERVTPGVKTLGRMAEALGVQVDDFFLTETTAGSRGRLA
jgi:transcriptional regulator with XRE-family HTH domain